MKITVPNGSKLRNPDFIFGVATAAFQIEGGAESRLPCIWDSFCDQDGTIDDGSNGLTACDHYSLWKQDVDLIKSLNVDAYRLSLSWGRVMNSNGSVNEEGLGFYIDLLTYIKEVGLKAFVTFYHWDLPQHLEDKGGWLNRETAYKFRDYVNAISQRLNGLVYSYATLNEPFCSAYLGYEIGMHAPGQSSVKAGRAAAHHLMLAHGLAMEGLILYSPHTENGIVLNLSPCYPASKTAADVRAAKAAQEYLFNWYTDPILTGKYPSIINALSPENMPPVQDGDMQIINHAIDFIGLNYYTREVYAASDIGLYAKVEPNEYPLTDMAWEVYPQGLTDLLTGLNDAYDLPAVYITENGAAMPDQMIDGAVNDINRCEYLHSHINAVDMAVEQGVDIRGYFAWSLMDNFEWSFGYEKRFGIVYVDYETQKRTVKKSGQEYKAFLGARTNK